MEFKLANVRTLAELTRDSVGRDVRALRAQVTGVTNLEHLRNTDAYWGEQY